MSLHFWPSQSQNSPLPIFTILTFWFTPAPPPPPHCQGLELMLQPNLRHILETFVQSLVVMKYS